MATRTQTTITTTLQKAAPSAPLKVSKLPKGSVLAFSYQPTRSIALG
jgi:hypothetical protein